MIDLLKNLISCKSVTPNEAGSFAIIKEQLSDFKSLEFNKCDVKNLFLYKEFSCNLDSSIHICFMGHVDVVPAGEGWEFDPFIPKENDGFIYGRGAQDMKSGVAAFINAIKNFKLDSKESNNSKLIISTLLTSDEEGDGIYGTNYALSCLKELNLIPNYAIVAEPTCNTLLGDTIKVGRRGSISGTLILKGKQGHVAYPNKCINPISLLGENLKLLSGVSLDNGDEFFSPSLLVATHISAGMEVSNVTPGSLKIMFNVRNSPNTTKDDVKHHIENVIKILESKGLECELKLSQSSNPFITDASSKLVKTLIKSTECIANITPELSTSGGTSDARFCAPYGIEAVELGVCNDRIHAINERVEVKQVEQLSKIFSDFLERIINE